MSQERYKGIECDQCGNHSSYGLKLRFSVTGSWAVPPKGKHTVDDVDFYGFFCSKECMYSFLNRFYFNVGIEVEDE